MFAVRAAGLQPLRWCDAARPECWPARACLQLPCLALGGCGRLVALMRQGLYSIVRCVEPSASSVQDFPSRLGRVP